MSLLLRETHLKIDTNCVRPFAVLTTSDWSLFRHAKVLYVHSYISCGILRNPDSDSDPDSDSKKIRTREKPGPGLEKNPDSCLKKPGLDF